VILSSSFLRSRSENVSKSNRTNAEKTPAIQIFHVFLLFSPFLHLSFCVCVSHSWSIHSEFISALLFSFWSQKFHLTTLSLANIIVRNVSYEGMDKYNTDGGKVKHSEVNPLQVPLCPSQIPHILAHCWALASHTTWHVVQPPPFSPFNSMFVFPFLCLCIHSFLLWFISHVIPSFRSHFHLSPLLSERPLRTQSEDVELGSSEALKFGIVCYSILCPGCIPFPATTPSFL
jgi:hypothetical protein